MTITLQPAIEPNKWWADIDDEMYVGTAGNTKVVANRARHNGDGEIYLAQQLPYNEIARRRFSTGVNVISVMHQWGSRVLVWHYPLPGYGYWRIPSTDDVRRWVDSLGYVRLGTVEIGHIGNSFMGVHQYRLPSDRTFPVARPYIELEIK